MGAWAGAGARAGTRIEQRVRRQGQGQASGRLAQLMSVSPPLPSFRRTASPLVDLPLAPAL
jgi:hypothetical protein